MCVIGDYLDDCELRDLNPETVADYRRILRRFDREVGIDSGDIRAARAHLYQWDNPTTRHDYYRHIQTFMRWRAKRGLGANWMEGLHIKMPTPPPVEVLTTEQVERIIDQIPTDTLAGVRDRAMVSMVFYCGQRRDAVRTLTRAKLNLEAATAQVVTKGGRVLSIQIHPRVVERIKTWLELAPASPYVFPSTRCPAKPVCASMVTPRIKRYAKAAGIHQRVYTHLLRHSCGTAMAMGAVSGDVIQRALGHRQLSTTQRYIEAANEVRVREAQQRVFG